MDKTSILNTQLTDGQVALFYLGQEGFLIKYKDTYLLIDPYLTDYVDKHCSNEVVTWKRNYPAPISPEELDFVDYVCCTHEHFDHADPDTLQTIAKVNSKAVFIAPAPIKETLLSYQIPEERIIGAKAYESYACKDLTIIPLPAAHEELHQDKDGNYCELGYKIFNHELSIFHAGDCCIYEGLEKQLENIDLLMVPVNGRSYFKRYEQDIIGNMTIEEALVLAKETKADCIIPMHYDLYDVNCINPAWFVDSLYSMNPRQKFHMFVPGECFIYKKS